MKKQEIIETNKKVEENFDKALHEFYDKEFHTAPEKRLRSCSAKVITTSNYYILQSYGTKIACIDRKTGVLYDALRLAYGYTSTSAQHIAKFSHDYGAYDGRKFGCEVILRWYPA